MILLKYGKQLVDNISALSADISLVELGIPSDAEQVTELLYTIWEHWKKIGKTKKT